MSTGLQIEGDWPGAVTLRKGWGRATGRPWNPLTRLGSLRLVRGNSGFLGEATAWIGRAVGGHVLSPALYPSGTRIWERAGYRELLRLEIMEKAIGWVDDRDDHVRHAPAPNLGELEEVDRQAFDEFWHMGGAGLAEAISATPVSTVLETRQGETLAGYAILGAQLGICFLQRIAVAPDQSGLGLGRSMIRSGQRWARAKGCSVMVLNVRPDNERARSLYFGMGFEATGKELLVLSYPTDSLS